MLPSFGKLMNKEYKNHQKEALYRISKKKLIKDKSNLKTQQLDLFSNQYTDDKLLRPYFNRTFHSKSQLTKKSKKKNFIITIDEKTDFTSLIPYVKEPQKVNVTTKKKAFKSRKLKRMKLLQRTMLSRQKNLSSKAINYKNANIATHQNIYKMLIKKR